MIADDETLHVANVRPLVNRLALPVLALDLGTKMGWALRTSTCVSSGTMNWTEKRKGASRGSRLLRYWRWLHMVNAAEPLSLVVWEDAAWIPTAANANTAAAYAQFEGIALMFAARHDIPTDSVHNSTLKKAITGSGKHPKGTSKAKIAESVRALGYVFETQDECDAIAVLHWATARHRVARRILG